LPNNNLEGTLPDSISAFVNITNFRVFGNSLKGTFPLSAKSWVNLQAFNVAQNTLNGALPPLPFSKMAFCQLFTTTQTGGWGNSFDCPFPAGVVGLCTVDKDKNVTEADCVPTKQCKGILAQHPRQCAAWQSIYDALGGTGWPVCSSNREDPCSCGGSKTGTWVECSENNAYSGITKIVLPRGLNGTIPPAIGAFSSLTQLGLNDDGPTPQTGLSGPIPREIGALPLVGLSLRGTFDGTEFPAWINQLAPTLEILWLVSSPSPAPLHKCTAQLPKWLAQMTELNSLTFREPCLSGSIPDTIGQLTKLGSM
jgi:hypothetical protein